MDFIEVEVVGWKKYNPRKDYKRPWWFALSNAITTDPMFSEFSDAEFRAWIHILCTASTQNTSRPKLFFKHIERSAGIKRSALMSAISKLEKLQVIRIPAAICTDSVQNPFGTEQNKTIQNRTIQESNAHAEAFALFWQGYPNKKGKSLAEKAFVKLTKAGVDPKDLMAALARYRTQLKAEGTEAKYILHGPTFLGRYKDFLDPDYGQTENFGEKKQSLLEIIKGVAGE